MCTAKKAPKVNPAPAAEPMKNVDGSASSRGTSTRSNLQRGMASIWTRYADQSGNATGKAGKLGG